MQSLANLKVFRIVMQMVKKLKSECVKGSKPRGLADNTSFTDRSTYLTIQQSGSAENATIRSGVRQDNAVFKLFERLRILISRPRDMHLQ